MKLIAAATKNESESVKASNVRKVTGHQNPKVVSARWVRKRSETLAAITPPDPLMALELSINVPCSRPVASPELIWSSSFFDSGGFWRVDTDVESCASRVSCS